MSSPIVGIIMGSDSDLSVMADAAKILEEFNVPYELTVSSAHRTPKLMFEYIKHAKKKRVKIIIAGASGAAHLPGVVAAISEILVIGVPIKGKYLDGMDSLLSIVQMPPGVPVATVGINGAKNAGLLAVKILATHDQKLMEKIISYKVGLEKSVGKKAEKLEKLGYKKYLEDQALPKK